MIATLVSLLAVLAVALVVAYDFFHDSIPCVIYVWTYDMTEQIPVFYTNSYRKAKKVQTKFEMYNDQELIFGITEAWHNPDIPDGPR